MKLTPHTTAKLQNPELASKGQLPVFYAPYWMLSTFSEGVQREKLVARVISSLTCKSLSGGPFSEEKTPHLLTINYSINSPRESRSQF